MGCSLLYTLDRWSALLYTSAQSRLQLVTEAGAPSPYAGGEADAAPRGGRGGGGVSKVCSVSACSPEVRLLSCCTVGRLVSLNPPEGLWLPGLVVVIDWKILEGGRVLQGCLALLG